MREGEHKQKQEMTTRRRYISPITIAHVIALHFSGEQSAIRSGSLLKLGSQPGVEMQWLLLTYQKRERPKIQQIGLAAGRS